MYNKLESLLEIIENIGAKRIFIVCGKSSFALSGAEKILKELLHDYIIEYYSDYTANPKLDDVKKGVKVFNEFNPDLVISVGGGSAIDMAKMINTVSIHSDLIPENLVKGKDKIDRKGKPFIAIPTTAGSGSEATHFAVVYIDKVKYSLADDFLLPDYCILDAQLTMSTPRYIAASSAVDALSQSIESIWSIYSTEESIAFAKEAIRLIIDNVENAVNLGTRESKQSILYASHLAGKAINITKTTACHAISYPMTSYFGISHGNAVAVTIPEFLVWNYYLSELDIIDKRGISFVKNSIMEVVKLFNCDSIEATVKKIIELYQKIGIKTTLKDLGIISEQDIDLIKSNVNIQRMNNNPRRVDGDSLSLILNKIK
tara:strand:- start:1179 stop:2297 length:1119 start_codon:yes stop_codon:yes gene_type:complete